MDFTKWEKLINSIPLDGVVPFEVVENFLNELDQYDQDNDYYVDFHKNICFEECGLCEFDGPIVEAYEQQDQDKEYKRMFSKTSKKELINSGFIYLTEDGFIIPFTYQCFKQLINELKGWMD